jgi:hypothetical protein
MLPLDVLPAQAEPYAIDPLKPFPPPLLEANTNFGDIYAQDRVEGDQYSQAVTMFARRESAAKGECCWMYEQDFN